MILSFEVLSHETIRQILLQASDSLENIDWGTTPKKHVDTPFIEADGFWTGLQQKGRRSQRKSETHLAVVHEGWEKRQGLGHRADYRLKSSTYVTTIAASEEDIWEKTWLRLNQKYKDLDRTTFVINGDLAPWINKGTEHFKKAAGTPLFYFLITLLSIKF